MQYHKDSTCNISAGLIVSLNRSAKCLINEIVNYALRYLIQYTSVTYYAPNECLVIGPFGPIEKVSINANRPL